ncbi:MAG TPA: hypothetical protein G4N92_08415 [Anaerolineae bacterium]|nr:hypothetical protein [Anaerolineae bacterium]
MGPKAETLYCYVHPDRETLLRCNKCERPICIDCAVHTPTGYRCRECIRGQQKTFNTAQVQDYLFTATIVALLSFLGSYLPAFISFFTIFLAPAVSWIILEIVRMITKGRRSKLLAQVVLTSAIIGSSPLLALNSWVFIMSPFNIVHMLPLIWQAGYTILLVITIYHRTHAFTIR